MRRITVMGGGGTGIMMAADLSLKGHEVTLFEVEGHESKIMEVKERGYVEITGNAANGKAVLSNITTSIEEAMEDPEYILIGCMAQRQEGLMDLMVPYLKDGQVVCFSAGNCASVILKNKIRDKKVLVGEMQGNIYPCRMLPDGKLISAFPFKEKGMSAFPARDNEKYIEAMKEVYPCHAVKNVFETALNSPNTSIHLAGSILGTTKMETTEDFRLYRDGLSPSVAALISAVDEEKVKVMEKMGITAGRAAGQIYDLLEYEQHPELTIFRGLEGPTDVNHRYIAEDAYAGNSLMLSLAKEFGVETPVCEGLIAIASALNNEEFYKNGRTLEYFGLKGMSPEEINHYLEAGVK